MERKKREANRKGDVQEQKALQIRVRKNSKVLGRGRAAREREGGGRGGGDTHRKDISYSPKLQPVNIVLFNEVRSEIQGLIHNEGQ